MSFKPLFEGCTVQCKLPLIHKRAIVVGEDRFETRKTMDEEVVR